MVRKIYPADGLVNISHNRGLVLGVYHGIPNFQSHPNITLGIYAIDWGHTMKYPIFRHTQISHWFYIQYIYIRDRRQESTSIARPSPNPAEVVGGRFPTYATSEKMEKRWECFSQTVVNIMNIESNLVQISMYKVNNIVE